MLTLLTKILKVIRSWPITFPELPDRGVVMHSANGAGTREAQNVVCLEPVDRAEKVPLAERYTAMTQNVMSAAGES